MTTPLDDSTFRERVEHELRAVAAAQRIRLGDIAAPLVELVDAASGFVAGGKLLRPLFCFAGWQVAGGDRDDPRIARAAAAFEWLQGSALVHDDLMDGSDTRRGRPSVHRAFEAQHRDEERAGDAAAFGSQTAILLGDLLLSWADEQIRRVPEAPDWRLTNALRFWDLAKTEVIAGQFLDVLAQTKRELSVEDAMRVVRFKAATYTIERPLHVGAALAGGDDALLDGLTRLAVPLGEAFQLRDDVLGVFGDSVATGKPTGDDLREGKRTVLVARAAERLGPDRILSLLGRDDGVEELAAVIESSGARADVEADISRLEDDADEALETLGEEAVRILTPLARAATRRDR
ncbi:polyprenyl synthetase family protein [Aeromicrobium phragmitis]|uniref:Polyprenyl synthetase family protein n=1 Tax=Aeromicrobium phragmitis TaxID=2478914 RepID=A0A3L8PL05_9ACTN|nr:polyprenyl synthetase family protein [Aeromicrobium phragmitis]RLV56075.1 polyprenyl synthetase family protein [Aeromicrobium phragmitis]